MISETARGRGGVHQVWGIAPVTIYSLDKNSPASYYPCPSVLKSYRTFAASGLWRSGAWSESGRRLRTGRGDIGIWTSMNWAQALHPR